MISPKDPAFVYRLNLDDNEILHVITAHYTARHVRSVWFGKREDMPLDLQQDLRARGYNLDHEVLPPEWSDPGRDLN